MTDNFEKVIGIISPRLRKSVANLKASDKNIIQEIRLRVSRPIALSVYDNIFYLDDNGNMISDGTTSLIVSKEDIEFTFKNVCQYSLHSFQKELSQGFVTIYGGNRIGLCGTAVIKNNEVETIKDISGINIRIAREIIGCADSLYSCVFNKNIPSTLIIGAPSSGKTTVLRDLCRLLGSKSRVSLIDERNEISATVGGIPQNNVGLSTDVLCSYLKPDGIITALRVLSPQIIVCDEIGNDDDIKALVNVVNCGVKIIATAHAGSIEEVINRKNLKELFEIKAFDCIVLLGKGKNLGQVMSIKRMV